MFNTFGEHHTDICPKSKNEFVQIVMTKSYLDIIGSLTDDGWTRSASNAPPEAYLGVWIGFPNPELTE